MNETTEFEIPMPHRELLGYVLDKWSLSILNELCVSPRRFNELKRMITGITQKSLTNTLRKLERSGIVERVIVSTRPIGVEYRITPLGKTIRKPIEGLLAWAETYFPQIEEAQERFDSL